jgi:VIT1/CCC1 family predicted Fe2+/Mn2+ transporter
MKHGESLMDLLEELAGRERIQLLFPWRYPIADTKPYISAYLVSFIIAAILGLVVFWIAKSSSAIDLTILAVVSWLFSGYFGVLAVYYGFRA